MATNQKLDLGPNLLYSEYAFSWFVLRLTCVQISFTQSVMKYQYLPILSNVIGVGPVLMSNDELGLAGLSFLDLSNFFSLLGNC